MHHKKKKENPVNLTRFNIHPALLSLLLWLLTLCQINMCKSILPTNMIHNVKANLSGILESNRTLKFAEKLHIY